MIKRRTAFYGQQRLDVPLFRAAESSVANDFDVLAGKILAGDRPLVVRGFALAPTTLPIDPTTLQLLPAGGTILHPTASEPGTIFSVAANAGPQTLSPTNARMRGSFAASATNYVGIDLVRAADDSTIDVQKFLDATTLKEISESVALAITLDYVITVSTLEFSITPSVCPIAIVVTDGSGNATSITDARNMLGRLASGGSSPSALGTATWPQGRTEGVTAFTGGDKATTSLKNTLDTLMYRLWEIGGGQQWFSACSDRDLHLDYGQPVLSNGDNFDFNSGTNTISWGSLTFQFANSPVSSNKIADGSATILDGQCLYVDIDRANIHDGSGSGGLASLVPAVASLTTLGSPQTPGTRVVLAWRTGNFCFSRDKSFEVGRTFTAATTSALGLVQLSRTPGSSTHPLVVPLDANGQAINTATGGNGNGYTGTGNGTGAGVQGTGGSGSGSVGVLGVGGSTNGIGVKGTSTTSTAVMGDASAGTGVGGLFLGSTGSNREGVVGVGGGTGSGVEGIGGTTNGSAGVHGVSNATNGDGVHGEGHGTGSGGVFLGGETAGSSAVIATGGASNGNGVTSTGTGTGTGVVAVASGHNVGGVTFDSVALLADASARGTAVRAVTSAVTLSPDTGAAIRAEETQATNARHLPFFMLHPTIAPGGLGGVVVSSEKVAENDVDVIVANILAGPGPSIPAATIGIRFDFDVTTIVSETDAVWSLGTFAKRYNQVVAAQLNAATSVGAGSAVATLDDTGLNLNGSTKLASSTAAVTNKLTDRNIPKAACKVKMVTHDGSSTVITGDSANNGWSVTSVVVDTVGGRDYLKITFPQAFNDAEYFVVPTVGYDQFANTDSSVVYGNLKIGVGVIEDPAGGGQAKTTTIVHLFLYDRSTFKPLTFAQAAAIMTVDAPIWITVLAHGKQGP